MQRERKLPYEFRVVEVLGWVWLYDNSSRSYCCSSTPTVWAEPLYAIDGEEEYPIDSAYFEVSRSCEEGLPSSVPVEIDAEYISLEVSEQDAWETAREVAQGNHLI